MDYVCRKLTVDDIDIDMVMDMNKNYREFINQDCAIEFLEDDRTRLWAAIMDDMVIGFVYGYQLNRLNMGQRGRKMFYIH